MSVQGFTGGFSIATFSLGEVSIKHSILFLVWTAQTLVSYFSSVFRMNSLRLTLGGVDVLR